MQILLFSKNLLTPTAIGQLPQKMEKERSKNHQQQQLLPLQISFKGVKKRVHAPLCARDHYTVGMFKEYLLNVFEELAEMDVSRVWLVWKGKVLVDSELLLATGVVKDSILFMGTKSLSSSQPSSQTSATQEALPAHNKGKGFSEAFDPLDAMIGTNPELLMSMLEADPRMKRIIENNPQIRHALSDPSTLKEMLQGSKKVEGMRGHDRALANIENMPGGFQALTQFYKNDIAGLDDVVGGGAMQAKAKEYTSEPQKKAEPMPNPWGRPPPSRTPSLPANAQSSLPFSFPPPPTAKRIPIDGDNAPLDYDRLERKYSNEIRTIEGMGFTDKKEIIRALVKVHGNVELAIDLLVSK